jgi:hypothetical protein
MRSGGASFVDRRLLAALLSSLPIPRYMSRRAMVIRPFHSHHINSRIRVTASSTRSSYDGTIPPSPHPLHPLHLPRYPPPNPRYLAPPPTCGIFTHKHRLDHVRPTPTPTSSALCGPLTRVSPTHLNPKLTRPQLRPRRRLARPGAHILPAAARARAPLPLPRIPAHGLHRPHRRLREPQLQTQPLRLAPDFPQRSAR